MKPPQKGKPGTFTIVFLGFAGVVGLILGGCGGSGGNGKPSISAISVTVEPAFQTVTHGQKVQFNATVTGDSENKGVIWQSDAGEIDSKGLFSAPDPVDETRLISVRAISQADGVAQASAQVLLAKQGDLTLSRPLEKAQQIVVEPSGLTALVTERDKGQLSRVDLQSGEVTVLVNDLISPTGLYVARNGTKVWVVESGNPSRLVEIDLLENRPSSDRIGIGETGAIPNVTDLHIDEARQEALVINESIKGQMAVVNLQNGAFFKKAEFSFPTGVVLEISGQSALVTDAKSGKLFRVNLTNCPSAQCVNEVASSLGANTYPRSPVLSQDKQAVYLLECKKNTQPTLCLDMFLTKIKISGPQVGTPSSTIELGTTLPRWWAPEPGEHTALIILGGQGVSDMVRRIKLHD